MSLKQFIAIPVVVVTLIAAQAHGQAVVAMYGPTKSEQYGAVQSNLRAREAVERIARSLSRGLLLPKPIGLITTECGTSNAYYVPKARAIVLCLEFMVETSQSLARQRKGRFEPDAIERAAAGAVSFVLLHELGHALIHVLDIPVLGREEDAADQISAYLLLNGPEMDAQFAVDGALWLFRDRTTNYTRGHFADTHSLNPQRRINLACWAFGKDPKEYESLVIDGYLPKERALHCEAEYSQLKSAIQRLMGKYIERPRQ
jgi:Putative metallopeptidase